MHCTACTPARGVSPPPFRCGWCLLSFPFPPACGPRGPLPVDSSAAPGPSPLCDSSCLLCCASPLPPHAHAVALPCHRPPPSLPCPPPPSLPPPRCAPRFAPWPSSPPPPGSGLDHSSLKMRLRDGGCRRALEGRAAAAPGVPQPPFGEGSTGCGGSIGRVRLWGAQVDVC